ncbi:uncharacterized protein LOC124149535 [Haliotis rufescens]|uniref:uncharacterized protein LOC124149535 n=1 Tax=Haliotis rufescens TaxID=6454 RepID=UPI00201F06F4|nr:uncharacterized protein LOC124149535 [Haliotis rufescens]
MMLRLIILCCLPHILIMSALKLDLPYCPATDSYKWKEYDRECQQESQTRRFHCQYDASNNTIFWACAVPSECGPGTHAHIDTQMETVSCASCSDDFYQQHGKMSFEYSQPNCDYKKQTCGEGKFVCEHSSTQQDYKCSCDHQKGYVPNKSTDCDCFTFDSICDCGYEPCADGQHLAANYSCVAVGATSTTRKPTTESTSAAPGAHDSSLILKIVLPIVITVAVIAIICCMWKRRALQSVGKSYIRGKDISSAQSPQCDFTAVRTADSSDGMSQPETREPPTAHLAENDHADEGQTERGRSVEGQPERGQSDDSQPIIPEQESSSDRSRQELAIGTSTGESVLKAAEMTVSQNLMKEKLKELSDAKSQPRDGLHIDARNVILGAQGTIVDQHANPHVIPTGNNPPRDDASSLQMDMPPSYSSQTYPKQVDFALSDLDIENCTSEDETQMKQPLITARHPKPGNSLQNGKQSIITEQV